MRPVVARKHPRIELVDGLELRGWRQDDAAPFLIAQRDPLVARYAGFLLADRADALQTVQRYAAAYADGDGVAWAVSAHGGDLLGSLRFALHDSGLGCGSVGYWLAPEVRGRGVASTALLLGTRFVLERLGWHRIELSHAVENERSCAVARRAGYRAEGVLRDGMRYPVDDRWSDEHLHARLVTDPDPLG
ncbi:GNAT family N-acetyltransferase [Kineosporia sp. A_224]|uniref:GNAT family N-acetyltransferase n=1 Tax=Kineosporia sp. A_224 TaxID=1962180 RepID=UPI000B4A67DB|nr:GNAT family N-acetyltransferase [Kineosporia sp. A_224]